MLATTSHSLGSKWRLGWSFARRLEEPARKEGCTIVVPVPECFQDGHNVWMRSTFALAAQCKSLRLRFSRFSTNATVGLETQWCDHSVATNSVGCLSTYPLLQQVSPHAPRHLLPACTAKKTIIFLYHKWSAVMYVYIYIYHYIHIYCMIYVL